MTRRGFSLLEVLLSSALVGSAMTAAVYASSTAARAVRIQDENKIAHALLSELASEILTMPFVDQNGKDALGPDSGEAKRADFDDVDDYDGLSESPPVFRDGIEIPHTRGWSRKAAVSVPSVKQVATGRMKDNCKVITLTVTAPSGEQHEVTFVRAQGGLGDWTPVTDTALLGSVGVKWQSSETRPNWTLTSPALNRPAAP